MTTSIDTVVLDSSAALKQPDVSRLTTMSLDGTGVFDVLMKATKLHLTEEYEADRVTGDEYTKLYLGALTAVMQTSVQFLLNNQQEEKIQAEIALVRQKTVTELAQTDDDIPTGLGFNGDTLVEGMVASQKAINALQADLVSSQVTESEAKVALTGQQIITELAKTGDNISQASQAGYGFNDIALVAGAAKAEVEKTQAETALTEQKTATEVANTSDTKPVDLGVMNSTSAITGMAAIQKAKAEAETSLLAQKTNTELAQTSDSVTVGAPYLNTLTDVTGVIGTQKALYTAQTDGFARDAEQKVLKIFTDAWSVSATQSEADRNETNALRDESFGAVVAKAKAGIGVS